jgi:hypothetical protein
LKRPIAGLGRGVSCYSGEVDALRRGLLLTGVALVLPACKKDKPAGTKGSGVGTTKAREVGAFSALRVNGKIDFEISVGKLAPLEVTGDDNLIQHVTTRVEGTELLVTLDAKVKPKQPLRVRAGTERLERISAAYGAKGTVRGVRSDAFAIDVHMARVTAQGSSQTLALKTRGAAIVELDEFSAARATVHVDGPANVNLGYLEELDVTQSGVSRVAYSGEPKLTQNVTEPSRLIKRK